MLAFVLVLYALPSATQLEAKDVEEEKKIVQEMKKEIEILSWVSWHTLKTTVILVIAGGSELRR